MDNILAGQSMRYMIITLFLCVLSKVIPLQAQDVVIILPKAWEHTPVNVSELVSEGQIILYGGYTQAAGDDTMMTRQKPIIFMHYGLGAITDSIYGLTKTLTSVTEDTLYLYQESVFYKSLSGVWVYKLAAMDTAESQPLAPLNVTHFSENLSITLLWDDTSSSEVGYAVERDTSGGSSWVALDTTAVDVETYQDSGSIVVDGIYKYQIRTIGDYANSDYLPTGDVPVVQNTYLLTFGNSVFTMDSTAADSTVDIPFINTSGEDIIISDVSSSDIAVADTNASITLPDTVANNDTLTVEFDITRNKAPAQYQTTVTVTHDGADPQTFLITSNIAEVAGDWDYISDDNYTSWTAVNTTIAYVDGISDGSTSYDNCIKIISDGTNGVHSIASDTMDCQVGDRYEVSLWYYRPTSYLTNIQFYNAGTGYVEHSGSRIGTVIGSWANMTFDITWNDTYDKKIGGIGDTTVDSFDVANIRWRKIDSVAVEVVLDTLPPNPPQNFNATGYLVSGSDYVIITHTGSDSTDVANYTYFRGDTEAEVPALGWDSIGTSNYGVNTFTDTIPALGELWDYYATAVDDSANISSASSSDSANVPSAETPVPPDPPTSLAGVADTLAIHLTWTDASSDEDSFRVYRDDSWVKSLVAGTVAYTDTPLANNTSYNHEVVAYKVSGGESSRSNLVTTTTSDTVLPAPSSLLASGGALEVELNWTVNSVDEDSILVEQDAVQVASLAPTTATHTVTGLANNTSYSWRVRAKRNTVYSAYSNTVVESTGDTTTVASNSWKVDIDASGLNNGTSWTDAWESFADINSSVVLAGDTVEIAGGSYGSFSVPKSGSSSGDIVYMGSTQSGYNDTVVVTTIGSGGVQYVEVANMKVTGTSSGTVKFESTSVRNLTLTNLTALNVLASSQWMKIGASGAALNAKNITVRGCYLAQGTSGGQSDLIFLQGVDSAYIIGNQLFALNNQSSPHNDGYQGNRNGDIWIENNMFYLVNNKVQYNQVCYQTEQYGGSKVYAINNLFYIAAPTSASPAIAFSRIPYAPPDSIYYMQNTQVVNNVAGWPTLYENADNVIQYNNVWVDRGNSANGLFYVWSVNKTISDYNQAYYTGSDFCKNASGSVRTLSQWRGVSGSDEHDENTIITEPTFTNWDGNYSQTRSTYEDTYDFTIPSRASGKTGVTVWMGNRSFTIDGSIGWDGDNGYE